MKEALTPEEEISFSSFRDKTKQALEDKFLDLAYDFSHLHWP